MMNLTNLFVSLFYSGYIKVLPSGTFGSFISILILFPLIEFNIISLELFILGFIVIFLLSLYFKKFSLHSKSHDSKIIVIDEFLGIYLILIFYDQIQIINTYITVFYFILFRFLML